MRMPPPYPGYPLPRYGAPPPHYSTQPPQQPLPPQPMPQQQYGAPPPQYGAAPAPEGRVLGGGWVAYHDATYNREYFYHAATQERSWTPPDPSKLGLATVAAAPPQYAAPPPQQYPPQQYPPGYPAPATYGYENPFEQYPPPGGVGTPAALSQPVAAAAPAAAALPAGWTAHSDAVGTPYYHNAATGHTAWEFPVAASYSAAQHGGGTRAVAAASAAAPALGGKRKRSSEAWGSGGNDGGLKCFVGGLSAEVTQHAFRQFFQGFGAVTDAVIMMDRETGRSRGFGFVTFAEEQSVLAAVGRHDRLGGRQIEVKRATPRGQNAPAAQARGGAGGFQRGSGGDRARSNSGGGGMGLVMPPMGVQLPGFPRAKPPQPQPLLPPPPPPDSRYVHSYDKHDDSGPKCFVGGISAEVTEEAFRQFFMGFGAVTDAVIMNDRDTGRSRGFGFVTFADEQSVLAAAGRHDTLGSRQIEVRRATPRGQTAPRLNVEEGRGLQRGGGDVGGGRTGAGSNFTPLGNGSSGIAAPPPHRSGGGGGGPSSTPCRHFAQGNCRYGASCRFSHNIGSSAGPGVNAFVNGDVNGVMVMGMSPGMPPVAKALPPPPPSSGGGYENPHDIGDDGGLKCFVGGLSPEVTEEEFRRFFQGFGAITDAVMMKHR